MYDTQSLRPGFVYSTTKAAAILDKSPDQVRRMCDAGELWTFGRDYPGQWRQIALDIDGTEQLLGHSTARSRRARQAAR